MWPIGWNAPNASCVCGACIGDLMMPGATAFARMPRFAYSIATDLPFDQSSIGAGLQRQPQPLFRRPGGLNELQVHRTRSEVTISFIVPRASSTGFEPAYTRSAGSP